MAAPLLHGAPGTANLGADQEEEINIIPRRAVFGSLQIAARASHLSQLHLGLPLEVPCLG